MLELYLTVSSICLVSGQMLATITVIQLPPIESFKRWVSFDWRNCTNEVFLSDRPMTACSKKESDLLMYWASFCVTPWDWKMIYRKIFFKTFFSFLFFSIYLSLSESLRTGQIYQVQLGQCVLLIRWSNWFALNSDCEYTVRSWAHFVQDMWTNSSISFTLFKK